ncbi:MAG TPA: hypothetical protein VGF40_16195, partial [Thermoanaerobaculia bacterium]
MSERGDEIARRIEETIREAVQRMVADMKSSIDDVRDAVVQQLDAASQSVQADAKSLSVHGQLSGILDEIEAAGAPPPAPPAPVADSGKLRRALRAIEAGKSQVDVLNALLDQGAAFAARLAIFILKGDAFVGWKGSGFGAHGGNDENVKRFSATAAEIPDAAAMLRAERVVATDGQSICRKLGVTAPAHAVLIPMVIKDKIAAALYADAMEGERDFDRPGLELLVFTTGLLIDTLAIRKKVPSPSLSGEETGGDATLFATPEVAPVRPAAPPPPPPRSPLAAQTAAAPRVAPAPTPPPPPAKPQPPRVAPTFELEPEPETTRLRSEPGLRPAPVPPPPPPRQVAPPAPAPP